MRFRGVHHVELSVLDYGSSIKFYDRMFGWLGYRKQHPEWKHHPAKEMMRALPSRRDLARWECRRTK